MNILKSEDKVKEKIFEQLDWDDRVDANGIEVSFEDGLAKLGGSVSCYTSKYVAEEDVWDINGVKEVKNQLKVICPLSESIPEDPEIKSILNNLFYWNDSFDSSKIKISVKIGLVTLRGTVDALWKKTLSEEMASGVTGVIEIKNLLRVIPSENKDDKIISRDILVAIERNYKTNADEIDIKVENGEVYLSGAVPDREAYLKVINIVRHTTGVKDLHDSLIIE
ncbi:MAG: BON domain-containing protein [Candidatus Lokiarchaeota archaeon]|nr:BON domain-containing protein [Candidatus Lokiarchaeota archaeon]